MTIEEFIVATIPTTQPNKFGVYSTDTSAEIVDDKNKQIIMENKINIAEILKDCPKGMELDCVVYDDVKFIRVEECDKPICIRIGRTCSYKYLTKFGTWTFDEGAKCVIFPKGKTTWEGFQRPFKDGDILSYQCKGFKNRTIYIYMQHSRMNTTYYVALSGNSYSDFMVNDKEGHALNSYNDSVRLATEEEKAKLFQAIKDNGYKWNEETKTLEKLPKFKVGDKITDKNKFIYRITEITDKGYKLHDLKTTFITFEEADLYFVKVVDIFDITTLKPFDRVLVRLTNNCVWMPKFFSHYDTGPKVKYYPFVTIDNISYPQCIPYNGNEHLCRTTNDCDDYFKNW